MNALMQRNASELAAMRAAQDKELPEVVAIERAIDWLKKASASINCDKPQMARFDAYLEEAEHEIRKAHRGVVA